MQYKRSDRVGDLIKEFVASMIQRGDINDPRIGFVTITGVRMTRDLRHATVFFSMLGSPEEIEQSLEGLTSAGGFIRRAVAKRLKLRKAPEVSFAFDDSLQYSSRIEKVIKEIES